LYVRSWKHFDFALLFLTLLLIACGLAMIYSATYQTQGPETIDPLVYRQIASAAAGLVLFGLLAMVDYHLLGSLAGPTYVVALALLAVVLGIGQITHGAQRWINLGFLVLQPSEPAKLAVILALAKFVGDREDEMRRFRTVIISLAIVAVPTIFTFAQPDLGTSLVFVAVWLSIAVVGRIRWRYLALLLVAAVAATRLLWQVLQEYQRRRLLIFLNPEQDPLGEGYNIIQAKIGVGSGEFWGRGFLSGTQSQLHFLRVQYADFIFSVLAEEVGFIGAMVLLALFVGLALRGMRVAVTTRDPFGRLLATGVVTMIAFQVFVNVGMNTTLVPATGIPLPLISFGGSSLVTVLMGLGLVESVAMRRKRFEL